MSPLHRAVASGARPVCLTRARTPTNAMSLRHAHTTTPAMRGAAVPRVGASLSPQQLLDVLRTRPHPADDAELASMLRRVEVRTGRGALAAKETLASVMDLYAVASEVPCAESASAAALRCLVADAIRLLKPLLARDTLRDARHHDDSVSSAAVAVEDVLSLRPWTVEVDAPVAAPRHVAEVVARCVVDVLDSLPAADGALQLSPTAILLLAHSGAPEGVVGRVLERACLSPPPVDVGGAGSPGDAFLRLRVHALLSRLAPHHTQRRFHRDEADRVGRLLAAKLSPALPGAAAIGNAIVATRGVAPSSAVGSVHALSRRVETKLSGTGHAWGTWALLLRWITGRHSDAAHHLLRPVVLHFATAVASCARCGPQPGSATLLSELPNALRRLQQVYGGDGSGGGIPAEQCRVLQAAGVDVLRNAGVDAPTASIGATAKALHGLVVSLDQVGSCYVGASGPRVS